MCGITDIPDWTWCEGGLPYLWGAADPPTLDLMWSKSPISHVNNVTAPVYLMIGGDSLLFTKNSLSVFPGEPMLMLSFKLSSLWQARMI